MPNGLGFGESTTPHVHVPVVPPCDGRLQAGKVVDRTDLKQFKRAKDAARAEIDAEVAEVQGRLEGLRREESALAVEVSELEPIAECLSEGLQRLKNGRGARSREEVLRGEIAGLRERISVSEGQVREQRARLAEIDRRVGEAWGRLRHAVERVKAMGVNNVLDHVNNEPDSEWADAIAVYRAAQPSDFTDKIGKTDAHLRLHALGFPSGPYPVGTFAEMGSIAEWGRFLNENEDLTEVLRSGSVMWSREKDALRDAEALLDEVDGGMGA